MKNIVKKIKHPNPYYYLFLGDCTASDPQGYEIFWVSGPKTGKTEFVEYGQDPGADWVEEPYSVEEISPEKLMRKIREVLHHAHTDMLADFFLVASKWSKVL